MAFLVFGWYALGWAATLNYMAQSASLELEYGGGTHPPSRQTPSKQAPGKQAIVISFPVMQARQRPSKVQPQAAEIVSFNMIKGRMMRHKALKSSFSKAGS